MERTAQELHPHYARVRDTLREDIVAGVFSDDEHLVLSGLSARYCISMPPIHEALNQLQVEGLVVIKPNRGARVRSITPEFISEIFEIRMVLEGALVELSVPHFTAPDVAELELIEERFEAAIAAGDHPGVLTGNGAFHGHIYNVRPNHEAMRLLRQHAAIIATMRNKYGYRDGRLTEIKEEHRALIHACAGRDAPLARAIATSHIRHSVDDLRAGMRSEPVAAGAPVPGLGSARTKPRARDPADLLDTRPIASTIL